MKTQIRLIGALLLMLGVFFVLQRTSAQTIDDGSGFSPIILVNEKLPMQDWAKYGKTCVPTVDGFVGVFVEGQGREVVIAANVDIEIKIFAVELNEHDFPVLTTREVAPTQSAGDEGVQRFTTSQPVWFAVKTDSPHLTPDNLCAEEVTQTEIAATGEFPFKALPYGGEVLVPFGYAARLDIACIGENPVFQNYFLIVVKQTHTLKSNCNAYMQLFPIGADELITAALEQHAMQMGGEIIIDDIIVAFNMFFAE